jgi:hypothetical protein
MIVAKRVLASPLIPGPRSAPHDLACRPDRLRQRKPVVCETLPAPRLREKGEGVSASATFEALLGKLEDR